VQFSATSQMPAEGRQTAVDDWKTSAGQVGPEPVQLSGRSHGPAVPRQTKLAGLKNIPVTMFVGGDDSGWREGSEATKAALDKLGGKATLDVRNGEGHIIASVTGADLFAALEAARVAT